MCRSSCGTCWRWTRGTASQRNRTSMRTPSGLTMLACAGTMVATGQVPRSDGAVLAALFVMLTITTKILCVKMCLLIAHHDASTLSGHSNQLAVILGSVAAMALHGQWQCTQAHTAAFACAGARGRYICIPHVRINAIHMCCMRPCPMVCRIARTLAQLTTRPFHVRAHPLHMCSVPAHCGATSPPA